MTDLAAEGGVADYVRHLTAAGYRLIGTWRTGPLNATIVVETWGRRAREDAIVHIIAGETDIDAGSVVAGAVDVDWIQRAHKEFGSAWLHDQSRMVMQCVARWWGKT